VRAATSFAIAVALGAAAAPAHAQSGQAAATTEFDRGRALMKQHKYKEACAAFENSQKIDAQNGTLFNVAECSAHIGKLATAWLAYRELSQRDTNAARKSEAGRRAKDLEKRLPRLLVRLPSPPPGLAITINDSDATALVNIENPIDLGDYTIRATAPGYAPFETGASVTVEGKTVKVSLELVKRKPKVDTTVAKAEEKIETKISPPGETTPVPKPEASRRKDPEPEADEQVDELPPASHRARNGGIAAAAGGGLVVAGLVFGLRARSQWNDAQALCPNGNCASADDKRRGDSLVDSAHSSALWSTALVVTGAAVTAAGIYFVVTAKSTPTTALRIAPTSDGVAVVLGGQF
jgi:hypothetical protein